MAEVSAPTPRIEVVLKKAGKPSDDKVHTWPFLVRSEFLCTLFVMLFLIFWSLLVDAPLEEPANPGRTPNPSKAPWYFLGLQEILVFFDPWHAGVVAPTFIIMGLMVIPYIDINTKGNGYYTFKERKYEIMTFLFGFQVLWVSTVIIGTFLRGPGWNWFWPWQPWDAHKVESMTNQDLPYLLGFRDYVTSALFGGGMVILYFVVGTLLMYWWVVWLKGRDFMQRWGMARFGLTSFLFLNMIAIVVKMVLRSAFNIKYIMVTPWLNI